MSMESDLTALLKTLCPRVYPDFAPAGTVAPWVTYQAIGGQALNYVDDTVPDARHTMLQVNVWSNTRAATLALMHQIEAALRASAAFNARPASEAVSDAEEDIAMYGSRQDFDIWAAR